jgi:hypothetical protein
VNARSAADDTRGKIAANDAERTRMRATRQKGFGDYYGDRPQPRDAKVMGFGFGPAGSRNQAEPSWMPPQSVKAPFPPSRPGGPVKAVPTLARFDDIFADPVTPQVDTTAITEAETKVKAAGETLKTSLGVTVAPQVDTSSIDIAIGKAQQLKQELTSASAAASASSGIVGRTMRGLHADRD